MGLLNSIFKNKKETTEETKESFINWIPLTSLEQLKTIKNQSKKESVAIFKHSTRCAISGSVIRRFASSFDEDLQDFKIYYLDLLNYRSLSDEVGYEFQVLHQSPQLLVIKNEQAVAHASHYNIAQIDLKSF